MLKLLRVVVLLLAAAFLSACEDSPPVVMTYNVLNGAGVDALTAQNRSDVERHGYSGSRLDRVIEVINAADPDILGIQEAHQWDVGDPSTVQEVSEATGMPHTFFAESANASIGYPSAVLFSRFPIVAAENYAEHFSRAGAHVEIRVPGDQRIHVFLLHLHPDSSAIRQEELTFIAGELSDYIEGSVILLGDLNFVDAGDPPESQILNEAGLRHPLKETQGRDQIWVSEEMEPDVAPGPDIPRELTAGTSDHMPVAVTF